MTFYEILEVNENASKEVIHMAYKALCKKYHPDIFSGDTKYAEEQMKRINTAYDVLSDDVKRKEYDISLKGYRDKKQEDEPIDISKKISKIQSNKKKKIIISIILFVVLLIAVIVGILIINNIHQNDLDEVKTDETKYSDDYTVANNYDNNDDEQSFAEWSNENKEKSDFLDKHIVFVIDGFGNYYYTYDQMIYVTQQMEEYEFWAYNKEQAIELDYVASDINAIEGMISEKADFLDERIVFVIGGFGDYYFTYDELMSVTQTLEEYEFWAYNIESAISKGYKQHSDKSSNNLNSNNTNQSQEKKNTCLSVGCNNLSNNYNYYCSEHACAESGCYREKGYGYSSIYCSYHKCGDVMCENRKKDYGSYCSEHECANSYCTSKKSSLSDYCYIHDD